MTDKQIKKKLIQTINDSKLLYTLDKDQLLELMYALSVDVSKKLVNMGCGKLKLESPPSTKIKLKVDKDSKAFDSLEELADWMDEQYISMTMFRNHKN